MNEYDWHEGEAIRTRKSLELEEITEMINNKPTLKDAWNQFNEIYKVIVGKNIDVFDDMRTRNRK